MLPPAWLEEGKVMSAGFSERMKDKCLAGSTPLLGRECPGQDQIQAREGSGWSRGEAGSIWRNDGKVPSGLGFLGSSVPFTENPA